MRFQVVSHAGLLVEASGVRLLCDPWILGSTYWRSWWNYPPVTRELRDSLKPDVIYLTHIHWDHFQGPSLRKFGLDVRILIPHAPNTRILRDLQEMGFRNVVELHHGETTRLGAGFQITSYQINPFTDSALVVEAEGVVLLNANDAKLMGGPLKHLLRRHPPIDFALRSHSTANSRLCYEIPDAPEEAPEDDERYARDFAGFAISVGCRYAVPFASNHCHLHRDVYRFNQSVTTPESVSSYFQKLRLKSPEVKVMVSGDSWSSETGFCIEPNDWFENRDQRLAEYREQKRAPLEKCYRQEERARVSLKQVTKYFERFWGSVPYPIRLYFRHHPISYALTAGDKTTYLEVDLYRKTIRPLESLCDQDNPIQIHTSAFIFRQCLGLNLFSHLPISKRVRYRAFAADRKYLVLFNLLFNLYEYELLPPSRILTWRFLSVWARRWREIGLYGHIAVHSLAGRKFDQADYLPAPPPSSAGTAAPRRRRAVLSR